MITILTPPHKLNLTRNIVPAVLSSSKWCTSRGTKADAKLLLTTGMTGSVIFTIKGVEYEIEIVSAASDESGYQISDQGNAGDGLYTYTEYINYFYAQTIKCPIVEEFFDVVLLTLHPEIPVSSITFKAKTPGSIGFNLTVSPSSGFAVDHADDGTDPEYNENFTSNIDLYINSIVSDVNFNKIAELYGYPKFPEDDDGEILTGNTEHQLQDYLYKRMLKEYRENLWLALPGQVDIIEAPLYNLKKFKFKYFESYGTPATKKLINESGVFYCLLSGIGFRDFILHDLDYHDHLNKLLTSLPSGQVVGVNQDIYISFIYSKIQYPDQWPKIFITIYLADGTTYVFQFAGLAEPENTDFIFVNVAAGFTQLNVNDIYPDADIYKYTVQIYIGNESGADPLTEKREFILGTKTEQEYFIHYMNSFGAYDSLRCTSAMIKSLEVKGEEVERYVPAFYDEVFSQFEATEPTARRVIKMTTGYKKDAKEIDVMQELLLSQFVFIQDNDKWVPININRKNTEILNETSILKQFSFEFSPANEFKNYGKW